MIASSDSGNTADVEAYLFLWKQAVMTGENGRIMTSKTNEIKNGTSETKVAESLSIHN